MVPIQHWSKTPPHGLYCWTQDWFLNLIILFIFHWGLSKFGKNVMPHQSSFFLSFFHILNLDPNVNSWVIASKIAISTNRNARIWSFFGLGLSSANQSSVKLQINLSTYSPQLNLGSSSPKRCNINPRGSNNKFPFKYSTFYGLFIPTGSHQIDLYSPILFLISKNVLKPQINVSWFHVCMSTWPIGSSKPVAKQLCYI